MQTEIHRIEAVIKCESEWEKDRKREKLGADTHRDEERTNKCGTFDI